MKFETLKHRVERAEQLVDGRIAQTVQHQTRLHAEWKRAWTPGRIVLAGLATGFLAGRVRSLRALAALGNGTSRTRWLQLVTSLSGLYASLRASMASMAEEVASAAAAQARADADAGGTGTANEPAAEASPQAHARDMDQAPYPARDRRRPDPVLSREPQAAAAATELSE